MFLATTTVYQVKPSRKPATKMPPACYGPATDVFNNRPSEYLVAIQSAFGPLAAEVIRDGGREEIQCWHAGRRQLTTIVSWPVEAKPVEKLIENCPARLLDILANTC
jgi:hypothetical protein